MKVIESYLNAFNASIKNETIDFESVSRHQFTRSGTATRYQNFEHGFNKNNLPKFNKILDTKSYIFLISTESPTLEKSFNSADDVEYYFGLRTFTDIDPPSLCIIEVGWRVTEMLDKEAEDILLQEDGKYIIIKKGSYTKSVK